MKKIYKVLLLCLLTSIQIQAQHDDHDCAAHTLEKGRGFAIDTKAIFGPKQRKGFALNYKSNQDKKIPDYTGFRDTLVPRGLSVLIPWDDSILDEEDISEETFKANCLFAVQEVSNRVFKNSGRTYRIDSLIFYRLNNEELESYDRLVPFRQLLMFSEKEYFKNIRNLKSNQDIDMVLAIGTRSTTGTGGLATVMDSQTFNHDNAWGAINYALLDLAILKGSAPQAPHEIAHMLGMIHDNAYVAADGTRTVGHSTPVDHVEGISGDDTVINDTLYSNADGNNNINIIDTIHAAYMYYNRRTWTDLINISNTCAKGDIAALNNILDRNKVNIRFWTDADIDIVDDSNIYTADFFAHESGWIYAEVWEEGDAYSVIDSVWIDRGEVTEETINAKVGEAAPLPGGDSFIFERDTTVYRFQDNGGDCKNLIITYYKNTTSIPSPEELGIEVYSSGSTLYVRGDRNVRFVRLYNMLGQLTHTSRHFETDIVMNVENNSGIRIALINFDDGSITRKKLFFNSP